MGASTCRSRDRIPRAKSSPTVTDRVTRLGGTLASAAVAGVLLVGATDVGAAVSPRAKAPGPALTTSAQALDTALSCPQGVRADRDPVLLVPGAGGNPTSAFAGLTPVLRAKGYPTCGVTLPMANFGDIQTSAEYVVAAIRQIAARSDRPVSVISVSSGSQASRWALKWWPDLRSLIGDFIGVAPLNHAEGPVLPEGCGGPCPPAAQQGLTGSQFWAALNRGDETPGRLSYSMISSATDVIVPPPIPQLKGESDDSNILIQAICPSRSVDHVHMVYDAVAVALVLDALRHDGPARASRVPKARCDRTYAADIDPAEVERQIVDGIVYVATHYTSAGVTEVEPALKRYATRAAPKPTA